MILIRPLNLNSTVLCIVSLFVLICDSNAYADYQTNLLSGVFIQDGSVNLDVGRFSAPVVYDWNSDGKKDLLIGQRYDDVSGVSHGYVSFFENVDIDEAPYFDGSVYLEACNAACIEIDVSAWG